MFDKRIYIYSKICDRSNFLFHLNFLSLRIFNLNKIEYIYICIVKFREKCVEDVRIGEELTGSVTGTNGGYGGA